MIEGRKVALRPATEQDKRMIFDWSHRSDIAPYLYLSPNDRLETWEEWCDDWKSHYFDDLAPRLGRFYVILVQGSPVGAVAYNDIDEDSQRAELDIWMSCEANCGKGYGPDALPTLCKYLCQTQGVFEFWIQPSARNPRAIRAYEKAGFQRVDLSRETVERDYGSIDHYDSVFLVKRMCKNGN